MAEEKKKGILSKLFGAKNSCCCNMKIEEVAENQPGQPAKPAQGPSCCSGGKAKQDKK